MIQVRVDNPLIELRLLASRNFSIDIAVLFLVQFVLMGLTVFGAIWIQDVLEFNPIEAGLSLLPVTLPLLLVAPLAGRLYDRAGPRVLVGTGALLMAGGYLGMGLVLDEQRYAVLIPFYVAVGTGIGLIMTPANTDAMSTAPVRFRGAAAGVNQAFRQVGGTVGLAIMGTVVATVFRGRIDTFVAAEEAADPADAERIERLLAESQGGGGSEQALGELPPAALGAAADGLTDAVADATTWRPRRWPSPR